MAYPVIPEFNPTQAVDPATVGNGFMNMNLNPNAMNTSSFGMDVDTESANTGNNQSWMQSWGSPALVGLGSIFNGWSGLQQANVARDSLKESRRQFNMNWGAQRQTTNAALEEQQRRRLAGQGGRMEGDLTPEEYVMKWGIK